MLPKFLIPAGGISTFLGIAVFIATNPEATRRPTGVQRKSRYSNAFRTNICQDSQKNTIIIIIININVFLFCNQNPNLHWLLEIPPSYSSSNPQHLSTHSSLGNDPRKAHIETLLLKWNTSCSQSHSHLMAQFLRVSWWVILAFPHIYIYYITQSTSTVKINQLFLLWEFLMFSPT